MFIFFVPDTYVPAVEQNPMYSELDDTVLDGNWNLFGNAVADERFNLEAENSFNTASRNQTPQSTGDTL